MQPSSGACWIDISYFDGLRNNEKESIPEVAARTLYESYVSQINQERNWDLSYTWLLSPLILYHTLQDNKEGDMERRTA